MSPPKVVGEDEQGFTLHDGKSPFRVPKSGLSPALEARIRSMSDLTSQPKGGVELTIGEPVPVAPELNRLPEDPGLKAQRDEEAKYGAPGFAGAGGGTPFTPTAVDPGFIPKPATPAYAYADQGASGAGGGPGVPSPQTVFDPTRGGHVPDVGQGGQSGGNAPKPSLTPRVADMQGLPADFRAKGAPAPIAPPPSAAPVAARRPGTPSMPSGAADINAGFALQKRGAEDLADAASAQGDLEAKRLGAQRQQMEIQAIEDQDFHAKAAARSADQMSKWESASNEMKNISTTVDPGRFWASKDTGGKIAGIIGLVLGAFGTGPDGINRAAVMLNNAVDRDIDAQKAEFAARMAKGRAAVDSASSLYAMNRQIFGDELAARAGAKASALGLAENEVQKNIASAKAPAAQAQLQMLLGQIQQKKGEAANEAKAAANTSALQWAAVNAKAPGGQASATALTEIENRNATIHQSGKKLLELIDAYGTSETYTPGIEGQMGQLVTDMAVDAAKLKDPTSVARPGEVELELSNLFKPGMWQRDASAKAKIQAFLDNAAQRRATAYQVRGLAAPGGR